MKQCELVFVAHTHTFVTCSTQYHVHWVIYCGINHTSTKVWINVISSKYYSPPTVSEVDYWFTLNWHVINHFSPTLRLDKYVWMTFGIEHQSTHHVHFALLQIESPFHSHTQYQWSCLQLMYTITRYCAAKSIESSEISYNRLLSSFVFSFDWEDWKHIVRCGINVSNCHILPS